MKNLFLTTAALLLCTGCSNKQKLPKTAFMQIVADTNKHYFHCNVIDTSKIVRKETASEYDSFLWLHQYHY